MQQPTAASAILLSDVSLSYPAHTGVKKFHAIDGLNLEVPQGRIAAILGESGAGKSTLAKFLAGETTIAGQKNMRIELSGGSAEVCGISLQKLSKRTRAQLSATVGFLTQNAGAMLTPELNVGDTLLEPVYRRDKHFDREAAGSHIAEMMEIVALPLAMLQKYPHELSKGQRQRVAVLRALMLEPQLVIADEPTLGVDAINRPKITELLRWYISRTGASMLLITHDIHLLEALVEEVFVLQQGKLVGRGPINEIFRNAEQEYVRALAKALRAAAYDEIAER